MCFDFGFLREQEIRRKTPQNLETYDEPTYFSTLKTIIDTIKSHLLTQSDYSDHML